MQFANGSGALVAHERQRDVYAYDPTGQLDFFAVGENATDTFTYTVDDGNGNTDTAMVTINGDGRERHAGRRRRTVPSASRWTEDSGRWHGQRAG